MTQGTQLVDSTRLMARYAAKRINEEHRLARESAESAIAHAIRCGELLMQQKAELRHGEFGTWVEKNCEFSLRHAQRYMEVAKMKSDTRVAFESLREALGYSDTKPEAPTPQPQLQIAPDLDPAPLATINPKLEPMTEEQRAVWSEAEAQCGRMIADYADRKEESEQLAAELEQHLPVSTATQQAERLAADVLAGLKYIAESLERSTVAPRFNEHWERATKYAHYIIDKLEQSS